MILCINIVLSKETECQEFVKSAEKGNGRETRSLDVERRRRRAELACILQVSTAVNFAQICTGFVLFKIGCVYLVY
jgi:hypothetical protein